MMTKDEFLDYWKAQHAADRALFVDEDEFEFFCEVFVTLVMEDDTPLDEQDFIGLLRDNHPLTAKDKLYLADLLEGKVKARRGPPRDDGFGGTRFAAALVKVIKSRFRESGQRYRIHDLAVEAALETLEDYGIAAPARETVENALRRSRKRKSRRKEKSRAISR
jgi:hypothetical protein